MQKEEFSSERRGRGSRPSFRRRRNRHPGLMERDQPKKLPVPKGEIPESFANNAFGLLHPMLQHAVAEEGYLEPTPIQEQSIPPLLEGHDLLGCAQTGTGKTAAFLLPILHRLNADAQEPVPNHPRALVLAPTRELAAQIANCAASYGKFLGTPFAVVFGGVGQFPQVKALNKGAELVIATPGRLFDLMEQGHVTLECVKEFVLDEADRMLDMGFLPDIKRILEKLPADRHTQFFSATLSKDILNLAHTMVKDPVEITISPDQPTVDRINQQLMFVDKPNKAKLLLNLLQEHPEYEKVLVFSRTRHGADKIVRVLNEGDVSADAIHSDKSQRMRINALSAFKRGKVRVLVATDIASRGIDVDNITHVINYDLPEETESYVHRIGRTARAGASGAAISFVSAEERGLLHAIERMIKMEIAICRDQPFHSEKAEIAAGKAVDEDGVPIPAWRKKKERPERRSSHRPSAAGRRQRDFHGREEFNPDEEEAFSHHSSRRDRDGRSSRSRRDRHDDYPRFGDREDSHSRRRRDDDFHSSRRRDRRDDDYPRFGDWDEHRSRHHRDEDYGGRSREDRRSSRRDRDDCEEWSDRRSSHSRRGDRGYDKKRSRGDKPFRERSSRKAEVDQPRWFDEPFKKKGGRKHDDTFDELESEMNRYNQEANSEAPHKKGKGGRPLRSGSFDRFRKRR